MKVKVNIWERALLKIGFALDDLSFEIRRRVYRKYDPNSVYNGCGFNSRTNELIFSNEEEL